MTTTNAPTIGDTVTTTAPQSDPHTRWTVGREINHPQHGRMVRLARPGQSTWVKATRCTVVGAR